MKETNVDKLISEIRNKLKNKFVTTDDTIIERHSNIFNVMKIWTILKKKKL